MKISLPSLAAVRGIRLDILGAFTALRLRTRMLLTLLAVGLFISFTLPGSVGAQGAMDMGIYDPTAIPVPPPDPAPGTQSALKDQPQISPQTMNAVLSAIVGTITGSFAKLTDNAEVKGIGKTLTYSLFAIMFAWCLLKSMVQGDGINGIVSELVPLIATVAVITALLDGGVGQIVKFMDSVAGTFGASGGLDKDIQNAGKQGFTAIMNILTMPSPNTNVSLSWTNPGQAIGILVLFLIGMVAKLVAAFIIVIAIAIYMANVVLAHGSIMLAVALAPLMVPFMLVPAISFIFDGWLKFTLGATMIKVVGAFMIGFTSNLMQGLSLLSQKVQVPPDTDFASLAATNLIIYCGLVLMAFLAAYMMMQVPQLATGLLSGSAGAGFKGMRALTGGVGMQVPPFGQRASSAGKPAASHAAGAAAAAGGAVRGGYNAFRGSVHKAPASKAERAAERATTKAAQTPREAYGVAGGATFRALGGKLTNKQ